MDRSAQALGEAAGWDPEKIEAYGPMMAAAGSPEFNVKVVRAIGILAGWDLETTERVVSEVAAAEPEELEFTDQYDLAGFFAAATQADHGIVGVLD